MLNVNFVLLVFSKRAQYDNFRLLSIVVEEDSGIAVQQQYAIAQKNSPETVAFATTFSLNGFNSDDWGNRTIGGSQRSVNQGAVAVKVYKSIGIELKDPRGNIVMVGHPKFNPV